MWDNLEKILTLIFLTNLLFWSSLAKESLVPNHLNYPIQVKTVLYVFFGDKGFGLLSFTSIYSSFTPLL